ncbi:hypothetical protein [Rhodanobacter lindaniclasticus]
MLTAIDREKTKFYLRYKGVRGNFDKGRITAEDEVTSLVFDPMKYLPACDVTGFWQKIVGDNFLLHEVPVSVDVIFWPTRSYLENGESHWVQPDLRFDFKWSNGSTRIILVEIKWNSGLDEGQLRRQWGSYLSPGERKIARHVFIAKNTDIGDEGHRGGVIVKSWRDVQDVLNGFERGMALLLVGQCWSADFSVRSQQGRLTGLGLLLQRVREGCGSMRPVISSRKNVFLMSLT